MSQGPRQFLMFWHGMDVYPVTPASAIALHQYTASIRHSNKKSRERTGTCATLEFWTASGNLVYLFNTLCSFFFNFPPTMFLCFFRQIGGLHLHTTGNSRSELLGSQCQEPSQTWCEARPNYECIVSLGFKLHVWLSHSHTSVSRVIALDFVTGPLGIVQLGWRLGLNMMISLLCKIFAKYSTHSGFRRLSVCHCVCLCVCPTTFFFTA